MEYKQGERVLAKLPQFGLWHGVIVEISESKKDLIQRMNDRQKTAAVESMAVQRENKDSESDVENKPSRQRQRETPIENTEGDEEEGHNDENGNGKKKEKTGGKKRNSEETFSKAEEKKKKKMEEAMKLEARNKQLEEIIGERRRNENPYEQSTSSSLAANLPIPGESEQEQEQTHENYFDQPMASYWPASHFSSPYSAFQRYSYVGELMSQSPMSAQNSSSATFTTMASQKKLQDRCVKLELENEQLKQENERLKRQLERQGQDGQSEDVIVTPKKVEFHRQLASSFEKKTQTVRPLSADVQKVHKPTPVRLTYGEETGDGFWNTDPVPPHSASETAGSEHVEQDVPNVQGTCHWEESVTGSGVKKVRLHPELEVYLTQGQISQIKHTGSGNPRKMTIAFLDALFSKQQLAHSSAKGSRKAHNASCKTVSLPGVAIQAIKEFVLNSFKKESGEPCLTDPVFNDIINSKCATARRSLNRFSND